MRPLQHLIRGMALTALLAVPSAVVSQPAPTVDPATAVNQPSGAPTSGNAQPNAQPYEGLLRESDLRLSQFRSLLLKNEPLPTVLLLRYRGKEWNHVVFYDLDGKEALFRYRTDRFDDLAEKKVRDLLLGQAYRIPVRFVGLIERRIVYAPNTEEFQRLLQSGEGRPGFEFLSAEPIQPDFVIY